MNRIRIPAILLTIFILSNIPLHAGQLAPELAQSLAAKNPNEFVRVWIKMTPTVDKAQFKAAVEAQGASRAEQHRFAVTQLHADNESAQRNLLDRLNSLHGNSKVGAFKGHWIVNVVEAEVAASQLDSLASRPDVESIMLAPTAQSIQPIVSSDSMALAPLAGYIPAHLKQIRADSAWKLGYTGAGRLVCSFDNGVYGNHTAFKSRWRGNDGDSAAAWFDPVFQQKFPHVVPTSLSNYVHGTHVMGIICGKSDSVTTGVAYGAQWISAAVVDIVGASLLDAFEWAADPDGDPNTISDVPDVINHSWGFSQTTYRMACRDVVFDAIDATEALGIVNIFAAGNDGTVQSIYNPANGDLDSLYCFAVGSLDTVTATPHRALFSSQGPSTCLGNIKPNVMARGQTVYSCYAGDNLYGTLSGTSMSAPEVSGLVALLRQKNPNATVDQIKLAILNSTNRSLFPGSFPNDSLGWGEIDCVAALNALSGTSSAPNVRVYDFTHAPIQPGDTVKGTLVLQNIGTGAINVAATITGSNPSLTILSGSAYFGTINGNDTLRSHDTIRVIVSDTVTVGTVISLPLDIIGISPVVHTSLAFIVEPPGAKSFASHVTTKVQFTLSNFGVLGLGPSSIFPAGGLGFNFTGLGNDLWEGGVMLCSSGTKVASGVHSLINEPKIDFVVAPGGNMVYSAPGPLAPQQTYCAFADDNATQPVGLLMTQESYAFNSPNDDFIIVRYIIRNKNAFAINGVRFGLFMDWDVINGLRNAGAYDAVDSLLWEANNTGSVGAPNLSQFRGVTILDGPLATAYTDNAQIVYNPWVNALADGYSNTEKFQSLIAGLFNLTMFQDSLTDLFQVMAAGPLSFSAHGVDTVTFAVLAGATLADIQGAVGRARVAYHGIATDVTEPGGPTLPSAYALYQNYPNPFNPSTKISFDLPRESDYVMSIYNVLGQEVDRISGHERSGRVEIV